VLPWRCGVLAEFKAALAKLLGHAPRQVLFRDHLAGDGTALFAKVGELGCEGIVLQAHRCALHLRSLLVLALGRNANESTLGASLSNLPDPHGCAHAQGEEKSRCFEARR
jgi:hypothetical protein